MIGFDFFLVGLDGGGVFRDGRVAITVDERDGERADGVVAKVLEARARWRAVVGGPGAVGAVEFEGT